LGFGFLSSFVIRNSDLEYYFRLRLSGPRLYIIGAKSVVGYHLEQDTAYAGNVDREVMSQSDEAMITKDYLLVPGQVTSAGKEGVYALRAYSRLMLMSQGTNKMSESGLLSYHKEFTEPAKITDWAAVDGGIYYLAGDDRLVFLRGTVK